MRPESVIKFGRNTQLGKVSYKFVVERLGKEFVIRQIIHDFFDGIVRLLIFASAIAIVSLLHHLIFL